MSKDRIMQKIQKCLALSRSSNEHEAAAALRQAKALMDKHQLTMSDVELNQLDVVVMEGKGVARPPRWKIMLYLTVARAFGCSSFTRGGHPVFVGTAPNPEVAKYALDVLLRQLELNKKEFLDSHSNLIGQLDRGKKIQVGRGFAEGWVQGCYEIVNKFSDAISDDVGRAHKRKMERQHGSKVGSARPPKRASESGIGAGAAAHGYRHGRKAQIHAGMNQDEGPGLLPAAGFSRQINASEQEDD